ncbi:calcium-binding protein [Paracoccus laeviglucosivorans]|uniref:Hemolysin-type calcium-binding repeat-containing protein n=1 Tax=Paracoccus laeviglucosivorans TaxID=1197861 RepID=A0A521CDH7_9RHOB|nr:calcium-binding protein [Paracoccus laeviglucosivorans]SMO57425.1 Hemolysin-type calcium-binding repeat-containing protein [Paracoccus laeviglucosivorans]
MPTQNNDVLQHTSANQVVNAAGGADQFYWRPNIGSATFNGGDTREAYDPNPYMDRTGGDQLHVVTNAAVKVTFTTTEDGTATSGGRTLKFTGVERLHLGNGNDTIDGSRATIEKAHDGTPVHGLTVYAGAGNDSIIGTIENDVLDGGAGNDRIFAGAGHDFIQSSTGNDYIDGGAGNDNIRWGQGDFAEIVGNDTILGGAGDDLLNAWIKGGYENSAGVQVNITSIDNAGSFAGNSATTIGGARSTLQYSQIEQLWTHEGRDTIDGSKATIGSSGAGFHGNGRWGDDKILGSNGNDTLEGGEGRDTITGGRGNDLISANGDYYNSWAPGDGDRDTLIFRTGHGQDTVLGFDGGLDVLDLGGRHYNVVENSQGTLLTAGNDSILLAHVFDYI